ncbi:early transcribed membrane protein 12 [Plasmodium falciparum NF54]|uniref:Early transcribed membrane protein 12 n=2 Tax=Plasmodium falciparum TaxID=5833 RepID=Q8I522_PLAF7|nr:early transcribed membrane protein 12 [Plasmodium falciparum 3D7]KAF4327429.1 early transcribed membrane protein 12 [Plasmodium falciparum NF54]PKC48424.1 early transcribed membrane protein 12 [Plasmodium falciparum NF54]CZT99560.1 early transcribed membrane protein 12 [Plasmodium falciparum 3D7]|eukprot:XP_001350795.1 early transcribed membrane protein 12 [Plasmodium falciparum 3D7]
MKLFKILYLIAALLAINLIAPSVCNENVEGKKKKKGCPLRNFNFQEFRKKHHKAILISSVVSAIALLFGTAYGIGLHLNNKTFIKSILDLGKKRSASRSPHLKLK